MSKTRPSYARALPPRWAGTRASKVRGGGSSGSGQVGSRPTGAMARSRGATSWFARAGSSKRLGPIGPRVKSSSMVRPILTFEHPVLREKAKKVTRIDASIQRLLDDLVETMLDAPGAGLAANQIGIALRVRSEERRVGKECRVRGWLGRV